MDSKETDSQKQQAAKGSCWSNFPSPSAVPVITGGG